MTRMLLRRDDVIVGVDTHKNEHAAVVLDGLGGKLAELTVAPTVEGFRQLLAAATGHVGPDGRLVAFGVEGTGSYGIGLARFLAGGKLATPKTADGSIESLRLLKIACDTAVKARTAAMIALKAVLVTAADELRAELESLTDHKLIQACAGLDSGADLAAPDAAMRHTLGSLARRWLQLHEEIKGHSRHLKVQTKALAPQLVEAVGVGLDVAAEMLVTAGDNLDRARSEAAFAKMCGACPIPAGSGRTNGRHRLYRGGNRQANAAHRAGCAGRRVLERLRRWAGLSAEAALPACGLIIGGRR